MLHRLITKRWVGYFLLFFVIWYPLSLVLFTMYQVSASPHLFIAINIYTPLWFLFVAYRYFRKARNDWNARFVTSLGWVGLMFFFAALLVQPVYGYGWRTIINTDVLLANWINVVAILVAGMVARNPTQVANASRENS